jgi:hypothetical protein
MKIILHIGMSKCGSSALQSYLSSSEFYEIGKLNRIVYAAIDEKGGLQHGAPLIKNAAGSNFGYITSCSGSHISALDKAFKKKLLRNIASLKTDYDTLILSNEGWGSNPSHFLNDVFLSSKDLRVTILGFVRPQIEWLNSAWWQWGAWADAPFHKWINSNKSKAKWFELFSKWENIKWASDVEIKLLSPDIVSDFNTFLGLQSRLNLSPKKINAGLPEQILRLYQRNRNLRSGSHSSDIDFILSKHISLDGEKTPWVVPYRLTRSLIEYFLEDNKNLLTKISSIQKKDMESNNSWWSADCYLEKLVRPANQKHLKCHELEPILVSALEAIVRLNNELKK